MINAKLGGRLYSCTCKIKQMQRLVDLQLHQHQSASAADAACRLKNNGNFCSTDTTNIGM